MAVSLGEIRHAEDYANFISQRLSRVLGGCEWLQRAGKCYRIIFQLIQSIKKSKAVIILMLRLLGGQG
jgi:hypothetical protein